MDKKAQEEFNEYESPERPDDYNVWEEEQIARDQEGIEDEEEEEYDELTNTGQPPISRNKLAGMHSRELGTILLDWHGGQGSAVYSLGSTLASGHEINLDMVNNAIMELKSIIGGKVNFPGEITEGDRIEIENIIGELNNRFVVPELEEKRLDAQTQDSLQEERMFPTGPEDAFGATKKEIKMSHTTWVRKHCKFASLLDAFTPEERNAVVGNPEQFIGIFKNKYQSMASRFSDYSPKDIELALKQADAALFPEQGDILATPNNISEVMNILGIKAVTPQSKFVPDPAESFYKTRRGPQIPN